MRAIGIVFSLLLAYTFALAGNGPTDFSKAKWELVSNKDELQVYRWNVPKSETFAFKATGVIDSPITKVASVLTDIDREKEWLPDLESNHLVRRISNTERIEYVHIGTPFVIKDRDFVLRGSGTYEEKSKELILEFHSVEDESAPLTNKVRGEIHASTYRLLPIDEGRKTHVTLLVHVDPCGSVPKWIVNLFQKDYPRTVFKAIRKQASKTDVQELNEVKRLINFTVPSK